MNPWEEIKVGDLGRIVTGKTPKTAEKDNYDGEIMFVTPSDNMNSKYIVSTGKRLTEKGKNSVKGSIIPAGTVCVSCIGSDLGKVVITTEECVTNQQINSIVVNTNKYDTDFVYYSMLLLGKELNYHSKTSTAVPIVNKSSFSFFSIRCPSLETQKKISEILSSIDNKIINNESINQNLAQQAQAIYADMFITNADSTWPLGHLSDLIAVKYGKDHKKLDKGPFPVYGSGGVMRYVERPLYDKESVLIPRKGTLNNVIYVNEPFNNLDSVIQRDFNIISILLFNFKILFCIFFPG